MSWATAGKVWRVVNALLNTPPLAWSVSCQGFPISGLVWATGQAYIKGLCVIGGFSLTEELKTALVEHFKAHFPQHTIKECIFEHLSTWDTFECCVLSTHTDVIIVAQDYTGNLYIDNFSESCGYDEDETDKAWSAIKSMIHDADVIEAQHVVF